jgi:hypothetical protein
MIDEKQLAAAIRRQLTLDFDGERTKIGQILLSMKAIDASQFWEVIHSQGVFKCGGCGHTLDNPRFEKSSIHCEKCGKPALSLLDQ